MKYRKLVLVYKLTIPNGKEKPKQNIAQAELNASPNCERGFITRDRQEED